MFYSSTSNPEGRFCWLGLKVVLQLLQLFGELLLIEWIWHNELVHHEAATLGPGGLLLEKAAQGVLRLGGEGDHFHVLEVVLLVEEVLQLDL